MVTDIYGSGCTLSWSASDTDGGAAIISYIIERKEVHRTGWHRIARIKPHNLSYTSTTLTEGMSYIFQVFAENIEGLSAPLVLAEPVWIRRPCDVPEPPAGRLRVRNLGSDTVLIEWNAPYDDGGSRVIKYIVEYREVDSTLWSVAGTTDSATRRLQIEGLVLHTEYLFRVIAVNEAGASEPLEIDLAIIAVTPPGE